MGAEDKLKAQLKEVMKLPENQACVDCGDKRPTWASLITPPKGAAFSEVIGCFCCFNCSGAHRRMGTHICFVRSTGLDEFKETEIQALRNGGNELINTLYEGLLTDVQKSVVKPEKHTEMDKRSSFIKDKYLHLKWYDKTMAERKSTFKFQMATGQFDDFFAARAKTVGDGWHDSFNGPLERSNNSGTFLSPNTMSKMDREAIAKRISQTKMTDSLDLDQVSSGNQSAHELGSSRGLSGHRALLGTLERMDSKREMVDTIRNLGTDDENDYINPQNVLQKARRMRLRRRSSGGNDIKLTRQGSTDSDSVPKRQGSGDSDTKPRRRGSGSADSRLQRRGSDSDSRNHRSITFGADTIGAKSSASKLGRRRLPDRTKSLGSEAAKPRRRVRRHASDDTLQDMSSTAKSRREIKRSGSSDSQPGASSRNPVRRVNSADSLDDTRSGTNRRPLRRRRAPPPEDDNQITATSDTSQSNHQPEDEGPRRARSSADSRRTRSKSRSKSPGPLNGSKSRINANSRRQVRRTASKDKLTSPRGTRTPRTPYSRTQVARRRVDDQMKMNASKLLMGDL